MKISEIIEQPQFDDLIYPLATVYGEGANSSHSAWEAIANVMRNRVKNREWKHLETLDAVCKKGFDALTQKNAPFVKALNELMLGKLSPTLSDLILVCWPIFAGNAKDTTGGAQLYFSPKAQEALMKKAPLTYRSAIPFWAKSPLVEQTYPLGLLPTDDFSFWRYK